MSKPRAFISSIFPHRTFVKTNAQTKHPLEILLGVCRLMICVGNSIVKILLTCVKNFEPTHFAGVIFLWTFRFRFRSGFASQICLTYRVARIERGCRYLVDAASRECSMTHVYTVNCTLHDQIELHDALEHARSEKRTEQDKALAVIQEEENQARERSKVRVLN